MKRKRKSKRKSRNNYYIFQNQGLSFQDRYYRTVAIISFIGGLAVLFSFVVKLIYNRLEHNYYKSMDYIFEMALCAAVVVIVLLIAKALYYCYLEYKVLGNDKSRGVQNIRRENDDEFLEIQKLAEKEYNNLLDMTLFVLIIETTLALVLVFGDLFIQFLYSYQKSHIGMEYIIVSALIVIVIVLTSLVILKLVTQKGLIKITIYKILFIIMSLFLGIVIWSVLRENKGIKINGQVKFDCSRKSIDFQFDGNVPENTYIYIIKEENTKQQIAYQCINRNDYLKYISKISSEQIIDYSGFDSIIKSSEEIKLKVNQNINEATQKFFYTYKLPKNIVVGKNYFVLIYFTNTNQDITKSYQYTNTMYWEGIKMRFVENEIQIK